MSKSRIIAVHSFLKKKVTFLFSDRARCFSGVDSPERAGVAATAEGDDLSKVPAGIVLASNSPEARLDQKQNT